jgi:hypothetical protein
MFCASGGIWCFFTKKPGKSTADTPRVAVETTSFELFGALSPKNDRVAGGDVTHIMVNYGWKYSKKYACIFVPRTLENPVKAVENQNFSTVSTGLSTGYFPGPGIEDIHYQLT